MKIGHTGTFFKPGGPYQLGEFIRCRVLDIRTKSLLVEIEDGRSVEISNDAYHSDIHAQKLYWNRGTK